MPGRAAPLASYCILAVLCTGCLPSSCQRTPSRAVSPADSLSREITAGMVPDTLRFDGSLAPPVTRQMKYPRTVLFGDQGSVVVSDARRNSLFYFDAEGTFVREVVWEGASIPYLAGLHADTVAVFSPGTRRIDYIAGAGPAHTVQTLPDLPETALQYVTTDGLTAYLKVTGRNIHPFLARIDRQGRILAKTPLTGDTWRNAGPLRTWGDSLLSFSGFFPVVDVLPSQGRRDSLVLQGFDSPMLARTHAFRQGKGRSAPLVMSSAAPAGDLLFVLNIRPGWLQIDAYDRLGMLQHILLEPDPGFNKNYYPIDIAVIRRTDTEYRMAIAIVEPEPAVRLYTWQVPAGNTQTASAYLGS